MRGDWYQISLIFLAVIVTAFFGGFLYKELFPEYKIYQNTYIALEEFRSSYTGQPPPPFESKIKQIVLEKPDNGPPVIDRCTSCHVAVQFSHFSPTQQAADINGNPVYDESGLPVLEPNPSYIWTKLDQKIDTLKKEGNDKEAENLQALKTVKVGEHVYDMTKVLRAHPLIGRETRPFEYHSIDEYGCTVCHSGNGRGLTTEKAHGPVFDGQYEAEYMGPEPEFLEKDPLNDPQFSKVFNHKPGHELLFQTTPIYVGALLQANCVQCHNSTSEALEDAARETSIVEKRREEKSKIIKDAYENEKKALVSLIALKKELEKSGWNQTVEYLTQGTQDFRSSDEQIAAVKSQLEFVRKAENTEKAISAIDERMEEILGSQKLVEQIAQNSGSIDTFLEKHSGSGTLFVKKSALKKDKVLMAYAESAQSTIRETVADENIRGVLKSEIDMLISDFHRGENLYFSQGCYACLRIDGLARGGVGPELTNIGNFYPWYIKESMVWPQADLKTSTMPNFHLDHEELEDLTTFLLAQKGRRPATSEPAYKTRLMEWESGYKLPWEKPINPANLNNLRYSMTVFATEGCAACHRLKGFTSNIGFKIEKGKTPSFETLFKEREWFRKTIAEEISGSELAKILDKKSDEIDSRIVNDVRSGSLLEELESTHPQLIESYNTAFKYAKRAKNHHYQEKLSQASDPSEKKRIKAEWDQWQQRVNRVLMMYVQEYGLGRLVGPRPNWSGIYRSDEWLIEHFRKPSKHVARSIMPVLPFDDSKFYALTYMLDRIAVENRDEVRKIWDTFGFDPAMAYDLHCSQCHGDHKRGNGPVAEWIYPIPKNLTNADFLRNLTRDNAVISITHGVLGGPMPPWGEVADGKKIIGSVPVLTESEIDQLVDWLYAPLEGASIYQTPEEVDKWQYQPGDLLKELKKERGKLRPVAKEERVDEVFDVVSNPYKEGENNLYYIKKRYYTQHNLEEGREFFELNCAVCHGKEADGQGYRAGTMFDAKPRMLTNFEWINTRDDLRLLRSIKYGVPGTSMTPWGDQTSALQRLQLVMYIRSLSNEQKQRDRLTTVIYEMYEEEGLVLEQSRTDQYQRVNELKNAIKETKRALLTGTLSEAEAADAYKKELSLSQKMQMLQAVDQLVVDMREKLQKESDILRNVGVQLLGIQEEKALFDQYLQLISLNSIHYSLADGQLKLSHDAEKELQIQTLSKKMLQEVLETLQTLEKEKILVEGRLPSNERSESLEDLNGKILKYKLLQKALASGQEEAKRLRDQQIELYANYEKKLKIWKKRNDIGNEIQ
ncbi:c-type cytochrome [Waddlia chondrophila]|uniref:Putative membrane protein n=1 Tax=Waddlia chondrophila (strain ATCC VR-1470 / WSU 86-1044) TaxID=716544 RepID=D6YTA4_WADCW|nr:c-type cytochrome [Waddlia chondrophila]ADI39299.1 putative membrane protein [Waddlia chondrophila WSU 86-1044]